MEREFEWDATFDPNHPNKIYLKGDGISSDGYRNMVLKALIEAYDAIIWAKKTYTNLDITDEEIAAALQVINMIGKRINEFQQKACYEGDARRHNIEWKGVKE